MNEGMIQKIGMSVVFQHSLIQQANYILIGSEKIDDLHYKIGVQLLKSIIKFADYMVGKTSLLVIDQVNVASSIIIQRPHYKPIGIVEL